MIIEFFNTPAAAIKAANEYGRTIAQPIYCTIGIDGDRAIIDTSTVTGYHLSPNGIIHKDRKDGKAVWTVIIGSDTAHDSSGQKGE